jgi:hypothetical protein
MNFLKISQVKKELVKFISVSKTELVLKCFLWICTISKDIQTAIGKQVDGVLLISKRRTLGL